MWVKLLLKIGSYMVNKERSRRWSVNERRMRIPKPAHTTVPFSQQRTEKVTSSMSLKAVTTAKHKIVTVPS